MSLDRTNVQGHYEPSNCKWSSRKTQNMNQRRFVFKNCKPMPVEGIRAMQARIEAEYDEAHPY
jgi:hypothetical protein